MCLVSSEIRFEGPVLMYLSIYVALDVKRMETASNGVYRCDLLELIRMICDYQNKAPKTEYW